MKKLTIFLALLFLFGCAPEWEEKGFASEEELLRAAALGFFSSEWYSDALALGVPDRRTFSAFKQSEFYDYGDMLNQDNADQFMAATEGGFDTKEEYIEAKESNINTKEEWLSAIDKSKDGGFYNIRNYFKAKELGISTQKELTKYEYDDMIFSGIRSAGKYHAKIKKCGIVSQYLISTTKNDTATYFSDMMSLFNTKNEVDWAEMNEKPLNSKQKAEFYKAVGSLVNFPPDDLSRSQKKLMDYFTNQCGSIATSICSIARARKQQDLVYRCYKITDYSR